MYIYSSFHQNICTERFQHCVGSCVPAFVECVWCVSKGLQFKFCCIILTSKPWYSCCFLCQTSLIFNFNRSWYSCKCCYCICGGCYCCFCLPYIQCHGYLESFIRPERSLPNFWWYVDHLRCGTNSVSCWVCRYELWTLLRCVYINPLQGLCVKRGPSLVINYAMMVEFLFPWNMTIWA